MNNGQPKLDSSGFFADLLDFDGAPDFQLIGKMYKDLVQWKAFQLEWTGTRIHRQFNQMPTLTPRIPSMQEQNDNLIEQPIAQRTIDNSVLNAGNTNEMKEDHINMLRRSLQIDSKFLSQLDRQ
ncbi:hypothetical protein GJ496_011244 [Pomphorhynchus laevis]|nr:hypothetical protein GJ496_011244 [Pomphorhynchus laevis]